MKCVDLIVQCDRQQHGFLRGYFLHKHVCTVRYTMLEDLIPVAHYQMVFFCGANGIKKNYTWKFQHWYVLPKTLPITLDNSQSCT